ncbi:MAG: hypothetical protein ACRCZF_18190 [Gemmataceae bacterium]
MNTVRRPANWRQTLDEVETRIQECLQNLSKYETAVRHVLEPPPPLGSLPLTPTAPQAEKIVPQNFEQLEAELTRQLNAWQDWQTRLQRWRATQPPQSSSQSSQ